MKHSIFGYTKDSGLMFSTGTTDLMGFIDAAPDDTQFIEIDGDQTSTTKDNLIVVVIVPEDANMAIEDIEYAVKKEAGR